MTITALNGTTNVTLTCSIQLNNDIGPDHSALNVSWWSPASTKPGLLNAVTQIEKTFSSTLNIPLIIQGGQYCCNASLAGNSTVVSSCTIVQVLGNLL